jgi:hypothetical protein
VEETCREVCLHTEQEKDSRNENKEKYEYQDKRREAGAYLRRYISKE